MKLILLIIAAILPSSDVLRERCDLIEVNHFYDSDARLVFDQLLFFDWSDADGRFQLRAWRLIKQPVASKTSVPQPEMMPRFDHATGAWRCNWIDGELHREVSAPVLRESTTDYGPELTEREWLAKEQRQELRK